MREGFVFYRSFYEAIKELPEKNQNEIYSAIMEFALNFNEVELTGLSKTIFTLIKPQIQANNRRFENGKKPKIKQTESKREAKEKQNISKIEAKEKDKEKEKEKEECIIEKEIEEATGKLLNQEFPTFEKFHKRFFDINSDLMGMDLKGYYKQYVTWSTEKNVRKKDWFEFACYLLKKKRSSGAYNKYIPKVTS